MHPSHFFAAVWILHLLFSQTAFGAENRVELVKAGKEFVYIVVHREDVLDPNASDAYVLRTTSAGQIDLTFGSKGLLKMGALLGVPGQSRIHDLIEHPDGRLSLLVMHRYRQDRPSPAEIAETLGQIAAQDQKKFARPGSARELLQQFEALERNRHKPLADHTASSLARDNVVSSIKVVQLNPDGSPDKTFGYEGIFDRYELQVQIDGTSLNPRTELPRPRYLRLGTHGHLGFVLEHPEDKVSDQNRQYDFFVLSPGGELKSEFRSLAFLGLQDSDELKLIDFRISAPDAVKATYWQFNPLHGKSKLAEASLNESGDSVAERTIGFASPQLISRDALSLPEESLAISVHQSSDRKIVIISQFDDQLIAEQRSPRSTSPLAIITDAQFSKYFEKFLSARTIEGDKLEILGGHGSDTVRAIYSANLDPTPLSVTKLDSPLFESPTGRRLVAPQRCSDYLSALIDGDR